MTISAQKSALTSQVNLQDLQQMIDVLKVSALNASKKQMNDKKFIFSNYKKFKDELQRAFKIVNEK